MTNPFIRWSHGIAMLLVLACATANAQKIDDAWVVERVIAGKYDELRRLEAESAKGLPVAMYWWGVFLEACVLDRCDEAGARALWMKAAEAGHGLAKVSMMNLAESPEALDSVVGKIGRPGTLEERIGYILALGRLVGQLSGSGPDTYGQMRAAVRELVATEPRLFLVFLTAIHEGPTRHQDELRAMVEAGFSLAAEHFRRSLLLSRNARYADLLAMAKGGDLTAGLTLCETVNVSDGLQELPADLLAICERALAQGYVGLTPVLLRHHQERGNKAAAAFYAKLCASLPISCAFELADYYLATSGKSEAWRVWDAVAALNDGFRVGETGLPPATMRQVLSLRMRYTVAGRACGMLRYNSATKKFDSDSACPYRKPVTIPPQFIGGTR